MVQSCQSIVNKLNDRDRNARLDSLRRLMNAVKAGELDVPRKIGSVNNHIHTTYSFSFYSPTMAVWEAYRAGLRSAGIMDHDSISGADEFIEAGAIVGIATTIGAECRADFSSTRLNGRRINNPYQKSNAYISLHGIPHQYIDDFKAYFKPFIRARHRRNILMTDRINSLFASTGIVINYERDVLPLSYYREGGSVTERHILFAVAKRLIEAFGRGKTLLHFLKSSMEIPITDDVNRRLRDSANQFYEYDLLGLLKKEFAADFYIEATGECPEIGKVLEFAHRKKTICAYAYLGDVGKSLTGDKRKQKFEDDYLDELIPFLKKLGFEAVTYMPSRNSRAQLKRVMDLCERNGLLQISGEDINSPRQQFVNSAMCNGEFHQLVDMTWALIGHEKAATADSRKAFFSPETIRKYPDLDKRIQYFKNIGLNSHATSAKSF